MGARENAARSVMLAALAIWPFDLRIATGRVTLPGIITRAAPTAPGVATAAYSVR